MLHGFENLLQKTSEAWERYIGIFSKSLRLWVAIFNIYVNVFIWILQHQFDICMNCIMELLSLAMTNVPMYKKRKIFFSEKAPTFMLCVFLQKWTRSKKVTISLNIVRADILQISTIFAMIFYKNFYCKSCAEIAVFSSLN